MIIEYEGQRYPFDFADITVKQAIRLEKYTGMPFGEWGKAVATGSSLLALQAVGWLVLHEPVDAYIVAGSVIVIASVVLVTTSKVRTKTESEEMVEAVAD